MARCTLPWGESRDGSVGKMYPLVATNIANWQIIIEIMDLPDLPIINGDLNHSELLNYQRVYTKNWL